MVPNITNQSPIRTSWSTFFGVALKNCSFWPFGAPNEHIPAMVYTLLQGLFTIQSFCVIISWCIVLLLLDSILKQDGISRSIDIMTLARKKKCRNHGLLTPSSPTKELDRIMEYGIVLITIKVKTNLLQSG